VRRASQPHLRAPRWALSLLVWAALACLTWLDSDGCALALRPHAHLVTASVFQAIWAGIQALAGILSTAAAATVTYLAQALAFLATKVGVFLRSTGAMFAKVWDASKIVWNDVLKPALVWIDDHLKRLHDWLVKTFRPVFDFLKDVRERLLKFYKDFVRPVLDTIDFIRAINRVLLTFHITLLQSLDKVLQQIEQRIEEPILWLNRQLTRVFNLLDLIITFDGFYQRLTLIKSMSRYAPAWMRIAANARTRSVSNEGGAALQRAGEVQTQPQLLTDLVAYLSGTPNDAGAVIDAAVDRVPEYLDSFG